MVDGIRHLEDLQFLRTQYNFGDTSQTALKVVRELFRKIYLQELLKSSIFSLEISLNQGSPFE